MKLTEIQMVVHHRVLDMRSLEHFVNTRKFEMAFENAEGADKTIIEDAIRLADNNQSIEHLKDFINHLLRKELQEKSVRELRNIASKIGIPGFNKLSKVQLIYTIKEHENEASGSRDTSDIYAGRVDGESKKDKCFSDHGV